MVDAVPYERVPFRVCDNLLTGEVMSRLNTRISISALSTSGIELVVRVFAFEHKV